MFVNEMPCYEILSREALDTIEKGWKRIVTELGIEFLHEDALNAFGEADQRVEGTVVKLDPDFVLEQVARAPSEFQLRARNPNRTLRIGGRHRSFCPSTAARSRATVTSAERRRWPTLRNS